MIPLVVANEQGSVQAFNPSMFSSIGHVVYFRYLSPSPRLNLYEI